MYIRIAKSEENKSRPVANSVVQNRNSRNSFFVNNRAKSPLQLRFPGGFSIAFDFRKTTHNPPIIIINMEAENFKDMILPVAEGFETFWKGLY